MNKQQILKKLEEIMELVPEQRFGQILANYYLPYCRGNDCFYTEDAISNEILDKNLEHIKKQTKQRQIDKINRQIEELEKQKKILEKLK